MVIRKSISLRPHQQDSGRNEVIAVGWCDMTSGRSRPLDWKQSNDKGMLDVRSKISFRSFRLGLVGWLVFALTRHITG
jgi:hypothetical protein